MTPRIIFTDAVYFIRAIAASDDMSERAFDIINEFKSANVGGRRASLQTISSTYTLSDEDLTSPNYCRAMMVAGECLAAYAEDKQTEEAA